MNEDCKIDTSPYIKKIEKYLIEIKNLSTQLPLDDFMTVNHLNEIFIIITESLKVAVAENDISMLKKCASALKNEILYKNFTDRAQNTQAMKHVREIHDKELLSMVSGVNKEFVCNL